MPAAAAILVRLDAAIRELQALRDEMAGAETADDHAGPKFGGSDAADDLAPEHLIEISTAVERFNRPADTIRYWCRREGCGVKVGGRWMASPARIRRKLGVE